MNSNRPSHFINSQYSNNARPMRPNKTPYDRQPQTGNRYPNNTARPNSSMATSNSAGGVQNYRFQSPQAIRTPGPMRTQGPRQSSQLIRQPSQCTSNAPTQNQATNNPQSVQRSQSQPVRPQQHQNRTQHQSLRPPQLLVPPQQQSIRPQQQSVRPQQQSVRPQQQSVRPQQQSIRPQQQSVRPQQQSVRPQQRQQQSVNTQPTTISQTVSPATSRTSTPVGQSKIGSSDNNPPKQPSPTTLNAQTRPGITRPMQASPVVTESVNDGNKPVTGNLAVLPTPTDQQITKSVPNSPQLRLQRASQQPQRSDRSRPISQSSDDRNANSSRTNNQGINRSYQQRNNAYHGQRSNLDRSLSSSSGTLGRARFQSQEHILGGSGQQSQPNRNQMHSFSTPNKAFNSFARFEERAGEASKGNDGGKMSGGRTRLFLGNIPADFTEGELQELSRPHGTIVETFVNSQRGFAFVRYDRRVSAEVAKSELDNITIRGKVIRVRFAVNGAAIRVRNIPDFVSNELLAEAFSYFGRIERAVVIVDDRGKPTGEGVVEFDRKNSALTCISKCNENCFVLTNDLKPVPHRACHPYSLF